MKLPENVLCSHEFYGYFATFLVRVYKQESGENKGEFLSIRTVFNYLGSALNQAKDIFGATGSDASKLFFTCLDPKARTQSAIWYQGLKTTANRELFQRSQSTGEELDQSESPLYISHLRSMVRHRQLHA